ncbi:MAG: hypothetical protein KAS32_19790 [Candidatus Peribacteraceae bacterium]|nr:hypothetical protein [Candidatus Peribacteraceae bacterium]
MDNINLLLSQKKYPIDFRKFIAWAMERNLAELRIIAILILNDSKEGLNRLEIASMTNLKEVTVANILEGLKCDHIIRRVPRSRAHNPIKDIKKKEMDYVTAVNRYYIEWNRTPFPEGVRIMEIPG